MMEQLSIRLNNVKDTYYGFIVAVLNYVKKKQSRYDAVTQFMNDNPNALSSDILKYICDQDDFYEDAVLTKNEAYQVHGIR